MTANLHPMPAFDEPSKAVNLTPSTSNIALPFHPIPGISNFRDIGGWPITSTTYVRKHTIFRGADTTRVTPAGIHALNALRISTDFDLRNKSQVEKLGYVDLGENGIQRVWSPVFGNGETDEDVKRRYDLYASENVNDIVVAFHEILTSGAPVMATMLRHLLSTRSLHALFIHCTTGNNRTGVFVALLLSLLDVPVEYIVRDYTLSEIGLAATKHINIDRLLEKGAFKGYGEVEARRRCERMVGARPESMIALLEEIERRWGGAEGYFLGVVGLSKEEIGMIKVYLTAKCELGD